MSAPILATRTRPFPVRPMHRVAGALVLVASLAAPVPAGVTTPSTPMSHGTIASAQIDARTRPEDTAPQRVVVERARGGLEAVLHDPSGDGSLWSRGETYKAGFTRDEALYAPFLGSDAPRGYPLTFRLAEASVAGRSIPFDAAVDPRREGDTVLYERGALVELYELALDSVEQRFVFSELSERGEIVLRIATHSDLVGREVDLGFLFETELGGVRYGRATALDADGRSVAAPTTLTGTGIEIRVPADFVASAHLPLVIDPIVTTFGVSSDLLASLRPDVAYDSTTNRWLFVYEEIFSASDHDVVWRLIDAAGSIVGSGYVEVSLSQWWGNPACGNLSQGNQFLVAAEVGLPTAGARTIQGRLISASAATIGPIFTISTGDQPGDRFHVDVGGDPFDGGVAWYAVVWQRSIGTTEGDIHARLVQGNGTLLGSQTILVDGSAGTLDSEPSISKSNNGSKWNLAWQRDVSNGMRLYAARMQFDGTITTPSFEVASGQSQGPTVRPSASSSLYGTDRWIVAYQSGTLAHDIRAYFLDGGNVLSAFLLTSEEFFVEPGFLNEDQTYPAVDSDGFSFVVAYAETVGGAGSANCDVRASTIAPVGDALKLGERRQAIAISAAREDEIAIAGYFGSGGAFRRQVIAWTETGGGAAPGDIEAGLYDAGLYAAFCQSGGFGTPCPCGNAPASWAVGCNNSANTGGGKLVGFGVSSLTTDSLLLTAEGLPANALAIFNQGDALLANPATFGQGLRCVGGNLKRLYTKTAAGGTASAPTAGDASVLARSTALGDAIGWGQRRSYYVYYRDPIVLGGCPASATFNTTLALQAVWIP